MSEFWVGVLWGAGGLVVVCALALALVIWCGARCVQGDDGDLPWGSL